ncbi:alternate gene name: yzbB [Nonlabens ulvanivorans]|uniref:Alternate gene name: yzbB n=1 Tax=Nonlabens ulvanivorans TaxID=906888 RepID=A0A090QAI5_NONUL|nr:alternate gene name: yzbB [Nonlabens ulvanivorans]
MFFEGTDISVGRGTEMQFQVYGSPVLAKYRDFSFTPTPNEGAKRPLHNGKKCFGVDLRSYPKLDQINLDFLIDAYAKAPSKKNFLIHFSPI